MGLYYNEHKVRNLYYNGKCITRLALGKEMTRLVEGDDFVRAVWLCGRNGAYIDTAYYPVFGTDVFDCHFRYDGTVRNPDGVEQDAFGVNKNGCRISAYINGNNYLSCNYFKPGNGYFPSTGKYSKDWIVSELMTVGSNFQYTANGIVYSFTNQSMPSFTSSESLLLFNCRQGANLTNYLHGDIAYFRIFDPTFTTVRVNMTPCRLLRPIPASLDGNGIARNADDCGMYNSVNGLFYGNVGSGTFTVSDD